MKPHTQTKRPTAAAAATAASPAPKKMRARAKPLPVAPPEAVLPAPDSAAHCRGWYIALLAAGVVLLGVSAALAFSGTMSGWEQRIFAHINNVQAPGWLASQVAKPLSNAVWGMVALVVVLLAFPKFRWRAWQYVVAAGSAYVLDFIVEHVVDRPRPMGLHVEVILRAMQGGAGFPSGHVATLTALCLTIWPHVGWPWRILLVLFVGAEAWSRLFLGVHAPLDIVGGVAVGMAAVGAIHLAPAKLRNLLRIQA